MQSSNSSQRQSAMARAAAYFDKGEFAAELSRRVAIPSQSQVPEGLPYCTQYLEAEMIPAFEAMGFDCVIYQNPVAGAGPVLLATRHEDDQRPTLLGYGHGDVIHGLESQWTRGAGPWQCARVGERLFGRGTADNKGQHTINMAALKAVLDERGKLGFNAKFMIETGEENGSAGIDDIISANLPAFQADVLIASDGPRVRSDKPTICLGARGAQNFDLVCKLRKGGHHSGNWGGALADPAVRLSHALAALISPSGQILVPEWLPPPLSDATRTVLRGVELDGGPSGPQVNPDWGEPGLSPAENVYAWNSFAVLAMTSGNPQNPVNAISPEARAHCQLRYIAGTEINEILPAAERQLRRHGFTDVTVEAPPAGNSAGFAASRTELDNRWVSWVRQSIENSASETPAVIPQMGGSICNDVFTEILDIPAIWIPHSYTACSQHAPDEHVLLPLCREALTLMAGLYWDAGELNTPP